MQNIKQSMVEEKSDIDEVLAIGGDGPDVLYPTFSELTHNISQYLGLTFLYQNMYDSNPLVPIDI